MTRLATFPTSRTFGVEIEFLTRLSMSEVAAALVANGIDAYNAGYTHATTRRWKVVSDASVSGGCEVVSPVLSGVEGLRELAKVFRVLAAIGGRVDSSCGIHVHVGASDLDDAGRARLVRLADDAYRNRGIRYLVSPSRRSTIWARAIDSRTVAAAENGSVDWNVLPSGRHDTNFSRYQWLNCEPLRPGRYGTVEFRLHQGSLDAEKVAAWTLLCIRLVETASETDAPAFRARNGFRRDGGDETSKKALRCLLIDIGMKSYTRDRYEVASPLLLWAASYLSARHAHFAGYRVPRVRGSLLSALDAEETFAAERLAA